ncbi:OmpP1/FadL family transporter [Desulfatiferula olefinivorans]
MKKIVLGMILSVITATASYAASVDTFGIGPKATALGGAVTAQSNDVFSIYYNPAGLSQLKGGQLSVALQVCDPDLQFHEYTATGGRSEFTGAPLADIGGSNIKDEADLLYVPFLGYAQPINDRISLGVAAYVPFGLDVEWSDSSAGSLNWFHSYYLREVVTPSVSYKINDAFSVGVGVSIGKSKSGAEKNLNLAAPSEAFRGVIAPSYDTYTDQADMMTKLGEINATVTAATGSAATGAAAAQLAGAYYLYDGKRLELELEDSFNYSMNVGLQYTPNDKVAVGLSYRGRAEADFDGDVTIDGAKVTTADMSYDHPEQVQVGVMVKPVPSVTLEMDVVWTNWSINSTQYTKFSTPLMGAIPDETLERNWNDTNQIRLGAEWQVNEMVALRCGYFYDPTPIPDNTFDIMWPDADRKTYSIGTGLNFGPWTLDASLQLAHAETKRMIGGESDNLNHSYNPTGITGYRVETSADGFLVGYGLALTYNF